MLSNEDEFFGDQDDSLNHVDESDCSNLEPSNPSEERQSMLYDNHGSLSDQDVRYQEQHYYKMGYLGAFDCHKDEKLQEGFESSYGKVWKKSINIGKLLGKCIHNIDRKGVSSLEAHGGPALIVKNFLSSETNKETISSGEDAYSVNSSTSENHIEKPHAAEGRTTSSLDSIEQKLQARLCSDNN